MIRIVLSLEGSNSDFPNSYSCDKLVGFNIASIFIILVSLSMIVQNNFF